MEEFIAWLNLLGDLHDSQIELVNWDLTSKTIEFRIEDIYWNYESLLEYPGPQPGSIVLSQVSEVSINISQLNRLWISECTCETSNGNLLAIMFTNGDKIRAKFEDVRFPKAVLKAL